MKKAFIAAMAAAALCLGLLAGCGGGGSGSQTQSTGSAAQAASSEKVKVVCSTFPAYDWVRQVVGDQADRYDITYLLESGVDLHSYQPSVQDIAKISDSDLFVYVGGESDGWVEDALAEAANPGLRSVNMLEAVGDAAVEEELVEGMQPEEGHEHAHEHNHGHDTGQFEDSEVADRNLSDWYGDWQSVYPYLADGTLDAVMERKAEENGDKTAEEYKQYYETGYKTDVDRIVIDASGLEFFRGASSVKSLYEYRGFQIYTYASGNKGVRYFFESADPASGAPRYIQFSDHQIGPTKAGHFHLYWGDESFDKLSENMENWPTYYPAALSGDEVADEMVEHDAGPEYDEHVWLSLRNAQVIVDAIAGELARIDAGNADAFRQNADAYKGSLADLDARYAEAVKAGAHDAVVFGDRFPFRYLVDDYHLGYYAAFAGCSAETEASFETVAFLAKKVDELGVGVVLTIEGSDQKIAKTIVDNTEAKDQRILTMDSLQSTTAGDVAAGASYLGAMEGNLEVLKEALG